MAVDALPCLVPEGPRMLLEHGWHQPRSWYTAGMKQPGRKTRAGADRLERETFPTILPHSCGGSKGIIFLPSHHGW